jgi:hypothetical protein
LSLSEGKIFEEFLVIVYITVKAKSTVFMVFLLHSPANKVKDVFTILSVSGVCDLTLFRIYENNDFFSEDSPVSDFSVLRYTEEPEGIQSQ